MNIKSWIIHLLGGYTEEERQIIYKQGKLDGFEIIRTKAKELYGFPADEWCELLYDHILWLIKEIKK